MNLYLLGNLETLGVNGEFCQFWGDFAPDGTLRGLINRYMSGWTLYGAPDAHWPGLVAVLEEYPPPAARLQDNPGGVETVLPLLRRYTATKVSVEEFMLLTAADFRPIPAAGGLLVRRAGIADLPGLVDHYADAGHMTRSPAAVERPLRDTRIWLGELDGRIVTTGLTNAETGGMAMVGGVFTRPEMRGRGYAGMVCSALCADLLADGKQVALYWDTPSAGAVYRRLGFQAAGVWRSVWLCDKGDE